MPHAYKSISRTHRYYLMTPFSTKLDALGERERERGNLLLEFESPRNPSGNVIAA